MFAQVLEMMELAVANGNCMVDKAHNDTLYALRQVGVVSPSFQIHGLTLADLEKAEDMILDWSEGKRTPGLGNRCQIVGVPAGGFPRKPCRNELIG